MITFRPPVTGRLYPLQYPIRTRQLGDRPTYEVTRRYGDMSVPQYGPHTGTDIGNGFGGDPVVAMAGGVVSFADAHVDGALMVWVEHGSVGGHRYQTRSIHLAEILVHVGQPVGPGDLLGSIGATGLTLLPNGQKANHLHQELWIDGIRHDPEPLIYGKTIGELPKEDHVIDPARDLPVAIADVAAGGDLYADPNRQHRIIRDWAGGRNIGLYAVPASQRWGTRTALAPIRIQLVQGGQPSVAWVGVDKLRRARLP